MLIQFEICNPHPQTFGYNKYIHGKHRNNSCHPPVYLFTSYSNFSIFCVYWGWVSMQRLPAKSETETFGIYIIIFIHMQTNHKQLFYYVLLYKSDRSQMPKINMFLNSHVNKIVKSFLVISKQHRLEPVFYRRKILSFPYILKIHVHTTVTPEKFS